MYKDVSESKFPFSVGRQYQTKEFIRVRSRVRVSQHITILLANYANNRSTMSIRSCAGASSVVCGSFYSFGMPSARPHLRSSAQLVTKNTCVAIGE